MHGLYNKVGPILNRFSGKKRELESGVLLLRVCLLLPLLFGSVVNADDLKSASATAGPQLTFFNQLEQSGILLLDQQQNRLESKMAQSFFIPASTTKLITALLALDHWGADFRFKTEFYLTQQNRDGPSKLLVKGFGDPFLVSEELVIIAKQLARSLKTKGINSLASIQLDTSYYQANLRMPGASRSENPYDAIPSAIAANFNTINIRKTSKGFESAEEQTPMTKTAALFAQKIRQFKKTKTGLEQRVNLGRSEQISQRYFAELLASFLKTEGIQITDKVEWQTLSALSTDVTPIYSHYNSLTLDEMIRPMMKYSTNFIANQLALNLSSEIQGGPANEQKVLKTYQQLLKTQFGWQQFYIEEGAGLSRQNRLTPEQLIEVLAAFKPWRYLLPEVEQGVFAKSGSLIGVSALAGYIHTQTEWYPFAFMINQKVPYRYRNKLARELSERY